jgi:hypothetical protein
MSKAKLAKFCSVRMNPRIHGEVLHLMFGSVVPVRRARDFETRNQIMCLE